MIKAAAVYSLISNFQMSKYIKQAIRNRGILAGIPDQPINLSNEGIEAISDRAIETSKDLKKPFQFQITKGSEAIIGMIIINPVLINQGFNARTLSNCQSQIM